ncbi:hypothetical protein ACFQ6S_11505, partial [Streptomyces sp. NPDC056479]
PEDPTATTAAGVTACSAEQLGTSGGSADAADPSGAVYGTFRFSNISTADCTVSGPGTVNFATGGAADATKIAPARHVSGDPAVGLPDPAQELTSLVLKPGAAYEVKFAWIPSETCPTTSDPTTGGGTGGGEPSPDPTPTDTTSGSTDGTSTGGDTGTSTQLLSQDTTLDGSVTVTNTTEAGAPTATVTVSNACAGTIYWTGVLAGA